MPDTEQVEQLILPANILPEDRSFFTPYLLWPYSNPVVQSRNFIIIFRNGCSISALLNPIKNLAPWPGFYAHFNRVFFLGRLLEAVKKWKLGLFMLDEYYYCNNEFSDNYFHWFTEVLPKMLFIKNSLQKEVLFFVPFSLTAYQLGSLHLCKIKFKEASGTANFFYKLNLVPNYVPTGCCHPGLLQDTAKIISSHFKRLPNKKRRVYVTRRNASRRKLLNEEEVCTVLLDFGFEILDFDRVSFEEQVEISMNTAIFIAQHGAALTNMIFMQPGIPIIEFLPKQTMNDKCYFALAGVMKHSYHYLFCEINGPSHITADYRVNVTALKQLLAGVIAVSEEQ